MARVAVKSLSGGIGEIRSAFLSELQYQAQYGAGWILCDGRSVSGSTYQTVTGSGSVPDLRGMVLRGKNNGRSDGNQNPDGELALGSFQSHGFTSHDHSGSGSVSVSVSVSGSTTTSSGNHTHTSYISPLDDSNFSAPPGQYAAADSPGPRRDGAQTSPAGDHNHNISGSGSGSGSATIPAAGGNETRMRNVTANHFIKINY